MSLVSPVKQSTIESGADNVLDILTGFIADTTSEVMDKVQKLSADHQPTIEEDSTVHTKVI